MDEYDVELQQLRRTLNKLREDEADPALIEEYAAEVRNHTALRDAARDTWTQGDADPSLARALTLLGYGDWTFDNVYSFVYDAAMAADLDGRELAAVVNETDYAASLRAALDA